MARSKKRRIPRKKPAQQRSRETVRAIVAAAARILKRDGYEGTNVNRVAELAGVSIGSLYQYFPTKEALVAAVAQDLAERTVAVFQEGIVDFAFLPLRDAARGVVERAVRALRIDPKLREVIREQLPVEVFDTRDFDAMLADAVKLYFQARADVIRPMNVDLAVAILRACVEGVALVTSNRGDPEEEVVEELTHLVYGYVAR
ncbi:MAG TPA: TetR/AcrR family transcriptional regulator [Polyangiaceae bacterium]